MAKTSPPAKRMPLPQAYEGIPLATPERTRLSDYPVAKDDDRFARLEKKLDEALEKLDRIDRRSRHLD
jgi:hypothetical protein